MSKSTREVSALSVKPDRDGIRAYINTRFLICIFLGFTSGLPLFVLLSLVQAWLKSRGVDIKAIGLFALVQFPYVWKFAWAPLLDRFALPFYRWRPGRRRGWMLFAQTAVMLLIATMGFISPEGSIRLVAVVAVAIAVASATSDIAIDAYRREILQDHEQGLGTAIHVNAYRLAGLVPGSISLILADHLQWSTVFVITALFMLPGLVMTILVNEPVINGDAPRTVKEATIFPFREFVSRDGVKTALLILLFLFLYKLGDSMATSLSTTFYLDIGFSKTEIGLISKTSSLWATIAGATLGGILLVRIGIAKGLWIFGLVQTTSILGFAWLASVGHSISGLTIAVSLEAFGSGLGTSAFVAYIASITDRRYAATQFALFTGLASIPRTFVNAGTGFIIAQVGWVKFFILCAALGVPGMLLLFVIAPWGQVSANPVTQR